MKTIPNGWKKVKLDDVCKTFSGGTPSRRVAGLFGGTIPWIKSGELNAGDVWQTEETIKALAEADGGELLRRCPGATSF